MRTSSSRSAALAIALGSLAHSAPPAPAFASPEAPLAAADEVDYQEGSTYAAGQSVKLNAAGNLLVVALVSTPQGSPGRLAVEIRVLGEATMLAFSYGRINSGITLLAGDQRLAARSANFTDLVVARFSEETLLTRMTTDTPSGTLVFDTTERPLVVHFEVPEDLADGPLQLELRQFRVGSSRLALNVKLQD